MKIKELNAIKRKHNRLLKAGQDLFAELEPIAAEMIALRKKIEAAEGDDYDPIPVLFGSGFWIDVAGEEVEDRQNDKQLIKRVVFQCADRARLTDSDAKIMAFALDLIGSIDAERGRGAVAFRMSDEDGTEYSGIDQFSCGRTGGEPLFLSPTIPEGTALVPIEPTGEMLLVMQDAIHGGYDDERRLYAAIRGAAQGERNAD